MNTGRNQPLGRVARAITDGRPVDWEALAAAHPKLASHLEQLRLIQSLADSQRRDAGLAVPETGPAAPDGSFSWGPLRVLEKIGAGSFGEVYRAYDPVLQRDVALKLRRVERGASDRAFALHLEEARRLARVRHPNVLTVHGVEVHDDRAGLWTDFIRGETLEQRIAAACPLPLDEILGAARDLCRALAAVHAAGVIHGDVKAANVMRDADGRVVLMDFGAGSSREAAGRHSAASAEPSATPSLVGTPLVMAPELLEGGRPTFGSDLYALGVLVYRLAAGRYPIHATTQEELLAKHRTRARIPLREVRPDLPESFAEAVERALAFTPEARYRSAGEMEAVLAASLGEASRWESTHGEPDNLHNLPRPQTRFIGRGAELAALRKLVIHAPLVTLLGPGGTGKTRLALELLQDLARGFADGVFWIDLAPIVLAERVPLEVTRVLGIREEANRSIEGILRQHLADRNVLLVLDNCEHLRAACARLVGEISGGCPNVRILATSREALGVEGERSYGVPPLSVPKPPSHRGRPFGLEIAEAEAVRLFLDRACRGRPGFTLTRANAPAIAEITRRLEGIPLSIELAAARVKVLSTEEIATRLREGLRVLATGGVDGPPHHATLRASIEWSYRLLSEPEQILLRRLSVFAGRWTAAEAEAVCSDSTGEAACIRGEPILELLTGLVEKSLVVFEATPADQGAAEAGTGGESASHSMLEMVRHYAQARLEESGEEEVLRSRHLSCLLNLAEQAYPHLSAPGQDDWLRRFEIERDNFRTALAWAKDPRGDADAGLRIAFVLRRFWIVRGYLTEGRGHLNDLLTLDAGSPSNRCGALIAAASLAWAYGDTREAERLGDEAIRSSEEIGDRNLLSGALLVAGTLKSDMGDYLGARAVLERALALRRELENKRPLATALGNLGVLCARMGDLRSAAAYYEESAEILREIGDQPSLGVILGNLSTTARELGDLARARVLSEQSLPLLRASGNRMGLNRVLLNLAKLEEAEGGFARAHELHLEALLISRDLGDLLGTLGILESFAELLVTEGDAERAARLFGAVDVLRGDARLPASEGSREHHEACVARAREALGPERFSVASATGRTMSLEQVFVLVLGEG